MTEEIRFEDLPKVTKMMMTKLEELCAKMDKIIPTVEEPIDRWFTVDELREYLPEHPARQTVYGWTSNAIIPFHKKGKSLRFKKSEVDKWLQDIIHTSRNLKMKPRLSLRRNVNHCSNICSKWIKEK